MLTAEQSQDRRRRPARVACCSLIRDGEAVTRADLAAQHRARALDASRSASKRCSRTGLVYEAGGSASTGGRPPTCWRSTAAPASCSSADLGATHSRLAVSATSRARRSPSARSTSTSRAGPENVLGMGPRALHRAARRARPRRPRTSAASASACPARSPSRAASRSRRRSCRAGTASRSRAGSPRHYDAPVLVDNDVNIMALGEHWTHWRDDRAPAVRQDRHRHRLRDRRRPRAIHRGAQGAAGDIGHVRARRPRRRHLPLRQHRLPRGGRGRRARSRGG